VNYLLDTHVFLWAVFEPEKLSKKARDAIEDPGNTIYVSTATYWEISLKYALGKLVLTNVLPDALPDIARQMGFEMRDVDADTASTFYKLPRTTHKDPFDRLVVWQAINKNVTLITKDKGIGAYRKLGLRTLWR
jgi:PIN domain nuclease of toxin-antitoxin system